MEVALVRVKFPEPERISSIMDKLQKEKAVKEHDPVVAIMTLLKPLLISTSGDRSRMSAD